MMLHFSYSWLFSQQTDFCSQMPPSWCSQASSGAALHFTNYSLSGGVSLGKEKKKSCFNYSPK
jgi:hypothetical protein